MKPTEVTTCFPTLMYETAINLYVRSNLTKAAAGISQPPSPRHGTLVSRLKKSDDSHYGVISLVVTTGP